MCKPAGGGIADPVLLCMLLFDWLATRGTVHIHMTLTPSQEGKIIFFPGLDYFDKANTGNYSVVIARTLSPQICLQ